jgi:hypothetical protein
VLLSSGLGITQEIDDVFLSCLHFGTSVPDIYRDNTLVRHRPSRQVFAIQNGTRHPISSAAVFFLHGWSFDDVVVVDETDDLEIMPVGGSLDS